MNGGAMDDVLKRARARLAAFGVELEVTDRDAIPTEMGIAAQPARLTRGGNTQAYLVVEGEKTPLGVHTRAEFGVPLLVITRHVGPRAAEVYRRAEIQYVDSSGNAWLRFGDVLIDVQGRRPVSPTRTRVAGNLFTTSRAQVVCVLLAWPGLWESTQREVARAAGVSLGQANNALRLIAEAGFGPQGRRDDEELLRMWAANFPTGLAPRLTLASYRGENLDGIRSVDAETVYRSGEVAAAELLRPATATLYVDGLDPRLAVLNRWRTDAEPNIFLRRAFWVTPTGEAETASQEYLEAPWPLVYADLLASDDPRVRGVAEEWRKSRA